MDNTEEEKQETEMDVAEYTDSLVAFLQEKLKDYRAKGIEPTIENLIDELVKSK